MEMVALLLNELVAMVSQAVSPVDLVALNSCVGDDCG